MRFSEAMEMQELEAGRLVAHFDRSWWVVNGPNGGDAALMVELLNTVWLRTAAFGQ